MHTVFSVAPSDVFTDAAKLDIQTSKTSHHTYIVISHVTTYPSRSVQTGRQIYLAYLTWESQPRLCASSPLALSMLNLCINARKAALQETAVGSIKEQHLACDS